jgi:hypothetical protein
MKHNITGTIIIVSLTALLISQYLLNKTHIKKLKRELSIEAIKTEFALSKYPDDKAFDSVNVKNDTVKFYKANTFIGMTTIVTD